MLVNDIIVFVEGRNNLEVSKVYKLNEIYLEDMPTHSNKGVGEESEVPEEVEGEIEDQASKVSMYIWHKIIVLLQIYAMNY